ncbi:hypothetical protein ACQP1V_29085 [Microtetraspora malaysiensis]|uniref:hypothetical protein n=1 Tax=Microtetraspora malaysiensis TaxID=161358 RepID=UPI003D93D525
MSAHHVTESPLDTAETSFRLLTTGPGSLSLDCATLAPGLPRGPVGLLELRVLLTSRHVADDARDAVWRELVARARQSRSTWTVAAVGMAIPALRTIALSLTREMSYGDPVDIDIAILAGYLRALHRVDLDLPDVRPRLCEAARCAGEHTLRYITGKAERQRLTGEPPPPPRPWFHPDLVLIDAVAEGVLSELDAELISLSRLEDVPLRELGPVRKPEHRRDVTRADGLWWLETEPPTSPSLTPSSADVDEAVHMASARSQGTPDAETATDPKGGRGTTPGSARISPNHPSVAARLRCPERQGAARRPIGCRSRRMRPALGYIVLWGLAIAAAVFLVVAAVATGAFAASAAAATPSDLNAVLNNLRGWLIGLLATLATLMLTIGGLRYLVAGGDPGEVQKAKAALKAAAFGYALAVLAPLFVSVLKRVVGG